jgi:hypothetical protein
MVEKAANAFGSHGVDAPGGLRPKLANRLFSKPGEGNVNVARFDYE